VAARGRRHHAQCLESGNVLILGTKSDLVPPGELHTAAARAAELALEHGFIHTVCSARTGAGVPEAINAMIDAVSVSEQFITKNRRRMGVGRNASAGTVEAELEGAQTCPNQVNGCFAKMMESIRCFDFQLRLPYQAVPV